MKIFLAGATGAIGRRLVPLLLNARYYVVGTTRSTFKADGLRAAGVEPVVVDVFDAQAVSAAVLRAHPDIIVHQLTEAQSGHSLLRFFAMQNHRQTPFRRSQIPDVIS